MNENDPKAQTPAPDPLRIANGIICLAVTIFVIDAIYALAHGRNMQFRVAALVVVLLIPLYWLRPGVRSNVAVAMVGLVVALFLTEGLITVSLPMLAARNAWKAGRRYDFRTREEVIRDLRKSGIQAYQRVAEGFPISGPGLTLGESISNSTIVYCNESGEWTIFQSDRYGFNNPDGVWDNKASQILSVGDSFTNGACVPPDKGFMRLIQQKHPATVNLGSGGNGPLVELAAMDEYGRSLKPKLILWCYFEGNDLDDLRHESAKPILMRYLKEQNFSQNLIGRQQEINEAMKGPLDQRAYSETSVLLIPSIGLRYYGLTSLIRFLTLHETRNLVTTELGVGADKNVWKSEEAQIPLFKEVMSKAESDAAGWDGQIYFVFLPGTEILRDKPGRRQLRTEVLQVLRELNIPVIDLYPVFQQHTDPLSLFNLPNPHYNVEGYRITAETIEKVLAEKPPSLAQ